MLNCFGPVRSGENIIGSVRGRGHKIYYFSVWSGSGQKITGQYGVGVPKTLPRRTLYYIHTTYRMSDHIVSYWTQFRRDKNKKGGWIFVTERQNARHGSSLSFFLTFWWKWLVLLVRFAFLQIQNKSLFNQKLKFGKLLLVTVLALDFGQWRSHRGSRGQITPLTEKNLSKIGKERVNKRKNWEKKTKIVKVLSLCPSSWEIGLAMLLTWVVL